MSVIDAINDNLLHTMQSLADSVVFNHMEHSIYHIFKIGCECIGGKYYYRGNDRLLYGGNSYDIFFENNVTDVAINIDGIGKVRFKAVWGD